jgi:ABC-type transport system involved in cytochrome bd biosynthesis fused ATPase/permease subunit
MLAINVAFVLNGLSFSFSADIPEGGRHVFAVGERVLADKLFYVLCGLDRDYSGKISCDDAAGKRVDFSKSKRNNVLAIGDRTMFISGTVRHNIYRAMRARTARKTARERTEEVIKLYKLGDIAGLPIKNFMHSTDTLLRVALARAHFREASLIVANCFVTYVDSVEEAEKTASQYTEKSFTMSAKPYIIEIT